MAKAKPKSIHSRAARRAASPSLDVDKSLTSLPRAENTVIQRESVLNERVNAGVSKKSKAKVKTRAQRLRQQKGMERAEIVYSQLEKKVAKSVSRAKNVKARRSDWESLNRNVSGSMFEALQERDDDTHLDDAMVDVAGAPATKKRISKPAEITQNLLADEHADIDVDDDIT
ncbi:hypothetical protein ALT_7171 [Aspergillus lentulus]|uniref:Alb1-domain-containing protein n=1 Tax=Aspergillus lentulus TaxID=293939 RepID=A0AAN4PNN9_ASPLE|nr:uncharacterized protein IFM58399_02865 [Aspergillus lentulus]KAF4155611.1 hypothetical protein CNMCM6069_007803 [Aspergillus lentulus]KAF4165104.1 hypothetical protein CNMCM6936_008275 [Aspergillus lentulus]KAF4202568.1 hypothetical protein CNMCM8927_000030 [Aspergillus lentulus]GAQ09850.1 hypothetical protein ALT_7171 [Aspergillus lentulus]GFF31373.1 hypothetical protein IFM58399_02865 [Aspergillus lentulus]